MWIKRIFQPFLLDPQKIGPFSVLLLLGPRQVGKSSLLEYCSSPSAMKVSLDDLETRTLANRDPVLFARDLKVPLLIDEIQYAPDLLSPIKILADQAKAPAKIWLTGSQSFEVMRGVRESLAGRVVILNLFGLSLEEKGVLSNSAPTEFFKEFFIGTFPALRTDDVDIWTRFMGSYVQTYIERDVAELLGIQKRREFEIFLKLCALRTGQLVNYDELARDAGINPSTAKEWLSVLQDSFLIKLVEPYFTNRSKRLIKTPKLYFIDSGLCAYLAGWRSSEQIRQGPWAGAFFETVVFGEILRWFAHRGKEAQINFWRTKDGEEVDFIVQTSNGIFPVEVKMGMPKSSDLVQIDKLPIDNLQNGAVISLVKSTDQASLIKKDWTLRGLDFSWLKE